MNNICRGIKTHHHELTSVDLISQKDKTRIHEKICGRHQFKLIIIILLFDKSFHYFLFIYLFFLLIGTTCDGLHLAFEVLKDE